VDCVGAADSPFAAELELATDQPAGGRIRQGEESDQIYIVVVIEERGASRILAYDKHAWDFVDEPVGRCEYISDFLT
jgi:hypothetical protein